MLHQVLLLLGAATASLSAMPPAFGVFYDVIGTAHFSCCTFRVIDGVWRNDKTQHLDEFESSSIGPASFSPSRQTYMWLGWNEEQFEQPYVYAIEPGGQRQVNSFPSLNIGNF